MVFSLRLQQLSQCLQAEDRCHRCLISKGEYSQLQKKTTILLENTHPTAPLNRSNLNRLATLQPKRLQLAPLQPSSFSSTRPVVVPERCSNSRDPDATSKPRVHAVQPSPGRRAITTRIYSSPLSARNLRRIFGCFILRIRW